MSVAALGVISGGRVRRDRRRATVAVVAGCAGILGGVIISRTHLPPRPAPAVSISVAARAVLAGPPFVGVACRSRQCDSVGVAVWLRRPATSVTAVLAGHAITLTSTNAYPRVGAGATFVGYLRPYRLLTRPRLVVGSSATTWDTGRAWPTVVMLLQIVDRGRNPTESTRLRVTLEPGWG